MLLEPLGAICCYLQVLVERLQALANHSLIHLSAAPGGLSRDGADLDHGVWISPRQDLVESDKVAVPADRQAKGREPGSKIFHGVAGASPWDVSHVPAQDLLASSLQQAQGPISPLLHHPLVPHAVAHLPKVARKCR